MFFLSLSLVQDLLVDLISHAVLLLCAAAVLFSFSLSPAPPSDTRVYANRSHGSWLGFGHNTYGQLGVGDTTVRSSPTDITALGIGTVESCALGFSHAICKKYV
jgi:hypothetical protein